MVARELLEVERELLEVEGEFFEVHLWKVLGVERERPEVHREEGLEVERELLEVEVLVEVEDAVVDVSEARDRQSRQRTTDSEGSVLWDPLSLAVCKGWLRS